MIIGLTGRKECGKSEVAKAIMKADSNFRIRSFAHPLKVAVRDIFGLSFEQTNGNRKEVIDERYNLTPRFIMQQFGTEVCRSIYGDIWIACMKRRLKEGVTMHIRSVIIDDVRFDNEAQAILDWGGILVSVVRPSLDDNSAEHVSEGGVTVPLTASIINDRDVEYLRSTSLRLLDFSPYDNLICINKG